jgi:hypothetical protein
MIDVIQAVLLLAIISSFIVFGATKTLKKAFNLTKIPVLLSLGMVYAAGVVASFVYWNDFSVLKVAGNGIIVGCVAVGLYESAVKSLLGIVPGLIDRIIGGGGSEKPEGEPK